jgi:sigma-B regulation protein RsbU (phosphoserine phosphatase)
MEVGIVDRFQSALLARRDRLISWLNEPSHAARGRGDGAAYGGDVPVLHDIDVALEHIEDGTFGQCEVCGDTVDEVRLDLDFAACVCLDHYSEDDRRRLERDLELAARVQQHLFPVGAPTMRSLEVAAHARPARIVSGDYYDYFCFRDTLQGIAIADVMGKGLAASLLMANLQASLRILGPEHDTLDALATRLNGLFIHNLRLIRFISLVLVALDEESGTLQYVNAGHNPPLHWDSRAGRVRRLTPTGPALGIMQDPPFTSRTLDFAPGDMLVMYTDGLVEARSPGGEAFGNERLERYLDHHHADSAMSAAAGLRSSLEHFTGGQYIDDVSLLVVRHPSV